MYANSCLISNLCCVIDAVTTKEKGRGRPRGSRVQNCRENANGNLDIYSNPSDMMEVSPGSKEEQEAGMDVWL